MITIPPNNSSLTLMLEQNTAAMQELEQHINKINRQYDYKVEERAPDNIKKEYHRLIKMWSDYKSVRSEIKKLMI